ncbi:MAG: hypothetical protein FJY92_09325, partial [Candidatus Hydrogenedentes bacterium]|nr:hypothetical protein [Candidatus Hydrogenedentota bacterium]
MRGLAWSLAGDCHSVRWIPFAAIVCAVSIAVAAEDDRPYARHIVVGPFAQQVHHVYTVNEGLPSNDVRRIVSDPMHGIVADTASGAARFDGKDGWVGFNDASPSIAWPAAAWYPSLAAHVGNQDSVRAAATHGGEIAVAAANGLFIGDGEQWSLALPRNGAVRWAPVDVRAVAYDTDGQLWFACPQGVGYRVGADDWRLFTGADGLPFNDFTCMAAGPQGVWFGTTNGA